MKFIFQEGLRLFPSVPFFGRTTTEDLNIGISFFLLWRPINSWYQANLDVSISKESVILLRNNRPFKLFWINWTNKMKNKQNTKLSEQGLKCGKITKAGKLTHTMNGLWWEGPCKRGTTLYVCLKQLWYL